MAGSGASPTNTFIVRLWWVETPAGPRWQGRIVHLQSGRSAAFSDPAALPGFVRSVCGMGKGCKGTEGSEGKR